MIARFARVSCVLFATLLLCAACADGESDGDERDTAGDTTGGGDVADTAGGDTAGGDTGGGDTGGQPDADDASDTDASQDTTADMRDAADMDVVEPLEVVWCRLPGADPQTTTAGTPTTLALEVYAPGATDAAAPSSELVAQLGWAAPGTAFESYIWGDASGLDVAGEDHDAYSASVTVPMSGTFARLGRVRVLQEPDGWVYCDPDGSQNGVDEALPATLEVTDSGEPIGFCRVETASATVQTGTATPSLRGLVYAEGVTPGAGQGAGLTGELVWFPSATPAAQTQVAADYVGDVDGLIPGDLSNDRYGASFVPDTPGTYGYVYRFSADGGASWTWCDVDGPFDAALEQGTPGVLTVADVVVDLPDVCNIQFPAIDDTTAGDVYSWYGRVEEAGVTDVGDDHPDVRGEVWVGPAGSDMATWQVIPMVHNPAVTGQQSDEYLGNTVLATPGTYHFAVRFSVDAGANWRLCDLNGTTDVEPFSELGIGVLRVWDAGSEPEAIDYCNIWQPTLSGSAADPAPTVTIELYEAGITDVAGDPGQIEVQVGHGALPANPAADFSPDMPGEYVWTPLAYKGPRPGVPQNYEYEGGAWGASAPATGTWGIAVRARLVGTQAWTYCDTNDATMDFLLDAIARLTVTP